ncbi:MAG: glycosyltransferase, partial [Bacteroidales bacterium]|nr:glycosyltransferase [Bacteroidales bacterium]
IALLDDDDWFLPGKIQKQVKALDNLDSDIKICVCWYRMIEGDGSFIEKKYTFEKNPSLQILWNEVIFTTSTMMFSKKLWEKLDGFNETFRRRQDIEFLVRACAVGEAYIVNEILCERLMLRRNLLNDMNEEIINLDLLKTSTRYIYENSNPKLFNKTTDVFNEIIFRLWIKKNEPIKAVSYMLSCGRSIGCFKEAIIRTLKNKIHRLFKKAI